MVEHVANSDEENLPNRAASYSKGLPHDDRGLVEPNAYRALLDCIAEPAAFNSVEIPSGCPDASRRRLLVNPLSSFGYELVGADPQNLTQPPAPLFSSAEAGAEMTELYWQALLRDVPFEQYGDTPTAATAMAELSLHPGFTGPRQDGAVTPSTLFRGSTPGDHVGPYLSQFLLQPAPFGAQYVEQRMQCPRPGLDYGLHFSEWLDLQRGWNPDQDMQFETGFRFIRNGRDLARWVRMDVLYQAYFNAALILTAHPGAAGQLENAGLGAPYSSTNPYPYLPLQEGFTTFGMPHVMALLGEVSTHALRAVWFQKWGVHRRLRPEVFGGRLEAQRTGLADFPLPPSLMQSQAVAQTMERNGTALLPLAYPEGSPLHPSYGAGHATVAGACVTLLKAFFDESYVIPNPIQCASDGADTVPYTGSDADRITVGGELNKLASNISLGRNFAGIHYRSDHRESLKLGEQVTTRLLEDYKLTYRESFSGFRFTRFDGTLAEI